MKNYIGRAAALMLAAPYAVASGGGALVGSIFGVAKSAIAQGARGPFELEGHYELPKDANAVAEGAKAYWDNTARVVTATAAGNTLIGAFTAARVAGATTAFVRLNGTVA
ncbi:hypothetical protein COA17_11080 [Sphingomonas ginsenosidimutans]|jgi:predicted RecA/RadA family phage recombinase|uniref:DUF2190 domain-containing protein n=1 Tax=Sphingomonas ginsenosidimutans TaxID=862134 RepID=A0A2A4HUX2_9SPHN|nr:DUF2190 family protein [Sphingomonas ginsenosidimutans]PCG08692.1 hypothetical protein COA17_11080 [Sphingomonas ginsenosidimutans]